MNTTQDCTRCAGTGEAFPKHGPFRACIRCNGSRQEPSAQRTTTFTFRCTAEEAERLQAFASRKGHSVIGDLAKEQLMDLVEVDERLSQFGFAV